MLSYSAESFVEADYLTMYPDIAQAIQEGVQPSGREHFLRHGLAEGRKGYIFDEAWYGRSYPLAVNEVKSGVVATLQAHYERIGRHRGYLPHHKAIRPNNPTGVPSKFGGLWVDQPNARDIVLGRLEIGSITKKAADMLSFFIDNGFVVIESAVDDDTVARAMEDFEKAYAGGFSELRFSCPALSKQEGVWQLGVKDHPAKALDIHWFSSPIRDLIFSDRVVSFLGLLFDAKPYASQTLGFYRGSAQEAHQDSAYVPYTQQRNFAASWIALEDAAAGAGELFYYPGSHRFADYIYGDRFKGVSEAVRSGLPPEEASATVRKHVASLPKQAEERGLHEATFIPKRGDALIWHPDLAHGGKPISVVRSRRSVVTHYCSRYASPLFTENIETRFCDHHGKGFFTSAIYKNQPAK